MLIINGTRPKMSGAERAVLAWLQASGIRGVAISGSHIPDRSGRRSQEVDLVLLTPDTLVCIEVKGILKCGVNGTLACHVNPRWSLPGIDGDPVHVRDGDTNPLNQLADAMFNLKAVVSRCKLDVFVPGLVLVEPNAGRITLDKGSVPMPEGRDVLLGGNATALSGWLSTAARQHPQGWTVERAHTLLSALDQADAVTRDALAAEGFPNPAPAAGTDDDGVVVPLRPTVVIPQAPTGATTLPRTTAPTADRGDIGRSPEEQIHPGAAMNLAPTATSRAAARSHWIRNAVLLGAATCLLSGGAAVLSHVSTSQHSDEPTSSEPAPPPAADAPAPQAPAATQPAPPAPASKPSSGVLFPTRATCFPFQADC
ncbi:nuclease-related domain-containing protein [Nocardia pseudovaccinii]|uniref:nuclease-related domain-containing protein n=1 Tax=Nocardia pseudovaccinii TaxID=189540 RepID=UPI0007A43CCE|nr:nuclease-related domain-containing protein [Nocardia pseudovaccinii]